MTNRKETMSEQAPEQQEDEERTQRLQAIVNHNTSAHVLMGLTDQEVMMVCLQVAFDACLHGFENDVSKAAFHLEETCTAMMRKVRHTQASQLILPKGVTRQ